MRLKTKLVLAITGLVFLVVTLLSWLYLEQLLKQRIDQSYAENDMVAHQIFYGTRLALHKIPSGRNDDPVALRAAVADSLEHDEALEALLNSAIRYSPTVFDIAIADNSGRALLSTDPTQTGQPLPPRQQYEHLKNGGIATTIHAVFGRPRVYNITLPLELNYRPFLTVRVGIRTTFIRNVFAPWITASFTLTGLAILTSLVVSALLANLALNPLDQISLRLDTLEHVEAEAALTAQSPPHLRSQRSSEDTVELVSNKIERIGKRMRNVEEVFSALKDNLDSIMTNLQDGIMLFTADARAVLVSDSVERFLGVPRSELFGAEIHTIFDRRTVLGKLVRDAFDARMTLVQEEIETEPGRRLQISLDLIHDEHPDEHSPDARASLGALLTLHDLESVREIESELELSRRLASIGRLTSGVGHEVKNPINAIVVHLELLRNKLTGPETRAVRHLDIIESEIQRLDRVVQTLVDFSRPVELQLREQDLRRIVSGVLMLASAELETHNVRVISELPEHPLIVKVDADLLKQAILNVVLNGAQSMNEGGELRVSVHDEGRLAIIQIADQGGGIPDDIREKIFDLYFTTKRDGSGIGLAMTYRIIQLHNGSIDVQSTANKGTTFTLKLPLLTTADAKLRGAHAADRKDSSPALTTGGTGL
ncbi:MAG: two-component system sensor histidine kinase NtrB [Acidobacteriaceae bacterium]